ncbi:hypothetical protein BDR04DRAFT_1103022 [Suillus decipiens]|nr:hypothetical protein BDR04DRAFT_1103022 [Suillus decipiens]
MAVSLVGRNAHTQAWLTKMLRSGQPSYCCVPQSVVDPITCNIQRAHHPLLPIMFLRYQCLISPQLFILALHILYFLMDTHITYSLLSIMHLTIHIIIRFFSQLSYTCASSFKCTSFSTLVTLLILTHVPNARLHNTLYERCRHCGVQIGIAADV